MELGNILGKVKDLVSGADKIKQLVDQLPEGIKKKVAPLIEKFTGGDTAAGSKAVKILEKNKDNDVVQKLLELLPKQ